MGVIFQSDPPEHRLKVCLLGETNVGKTSLVYRFVVNKFRENYKPTLGVNIIKKELDIKKYGSVSVIIWDLGGEDMFRTQRELFLEGSSGALVVYDLTERESFKKLDEWMESFRKIRGKQPLTLIGNKSDLSEDITVQTSEAEEYAEKNGMELIITSAKMGDNVESAFKALIRTILDTIY